MPREIESLHRQAASCLTGDKVSHQLLGCFSSRTGNAMNAVSLYERFKARLLDGELMAGQRLPSIRKLVASEQASYHAVVSAYVRLSSEGLIESHQGSGYFVSPQALSMPRQAGLEFMAGDPLFKLLQGPPESIKLGCGWLPPLWRDTELLARAIRRTARLEQSSLVEYGDIQGYLPLRKQLCLHVKRQTRLEVPPNQILTTLGATQALDLVVRTLIRPGEHVFVDEPGNGNLIKLIQLAGGIVVGVPRTQEGPDVKLMQDYLHQHSVRAFFCNSTYHNPTGGNLSPRNAFSVLRLAVEHGFLIIEDDVYGDFSPANRQTFAELDSLDQVIYIGSFSKSLSASLRVGYIACAAELIEPLTRLKLLTSVAVPSFCERFVNTVLVDGTYLRHMKSVQQQLMTHQKRAQKALTQQGWRFDIVPDGGMFLWVRHPDMADLTSFIARLAKRNVLLMPGSAFAVERDQSDHTRINIAHFSPDMAKLFTEGREEA